MKKRTSVNISNEYFFLIKHGKRNEYVEKLIKERMENLKSVLGVLRKGFSDDKDEIINLVKLASIPALSWEKSTPKDLSDLHREALIILWEETSATGIEPTELIDILWEEKETNKRRKKSKP